MGSRGLRLVFPLVAGLIALGVVGALAWKHFAARGGRGDGGASAIHRSTEAAGEGGRRSRGGNGSSDVDADAASASGAETESGDRATGTDRATTATLGLAERLALLDSLSSDSMRRGASFVMPTDPAARALAAAELERLSRERDEREKEEKEEEKPPARIAGRVTDEEGHGLAGAHVIPQAYQAASGSAYATGMAVTNTDGFYQMTAEATEMLVVRVMPPDGDIVYYATDPVTLHVEAGHDYLGVDFVLEQGEPLTGLVVDSDNRPIEGAAIHADHNTSFEETETTDAQGRFEIRGLGKNAPLPLLTVSADGFQPQSRSNLTALDGEQLFILQRDNSIVLEVTWAFDGTPVQLYAYRMMRKSPTGLWITVGREDIMVDAPDGRTTLAHFEADDWRVEVTVVDPEGNMTELRASEEIKLTEGAAGFVIPIKVYGGADIIGTVVLDRAGGAAIEGVKVDFVPPSAGFGRFPPPDDPFLFPTAYTDTAGGFRFEGMPPGRYALRGRKEPLLTPEAINLDVPWDGTPVRVEVVMMTGGVVFGTVYGDDGAPAAEARLHMSVQSLNADGWNAEGGLQAITDAEGNYRFEGLPVGAHYVWVYQGANRDATNFNLGASEEKRLDFDFSGRVHLAGHVTLNGESAAGKVRAFQLLQGGAAGAEILLQGDGSYEARVVPGTLQVLVSPWAQAFFGQPDPVVVAAEPKEQIVDLAWSTVDLDVLVQFPEGAAFRSGQLVLSPRVRALRYNFARYTIDQELRHFPNMFVGEYQATYESADHVWNGASTWERLEPDTEPIITIEPRSTAASVRVGGWGPGEYSNIESRTLSFDASDSIVAPGRYDVFCHYESGRHAVEFEAALLVAGGAVLAVDEHTGWAGADQWNNTYRLDVPTSPGGPLTLEIRARTDGGTDSNGSIYLTRVE